MIYYVSTKGNDCFVGSKEYPFQTIHHAARIAVAGDTVRVFGGTYREWVDPQNAGSGEDGRIVYEAVAGETPVIKGSEVVTDWERLEGTVWKKRLPNEMFGDFNPFAIPLYGDWLLKPETYDVHLGDVYLNGVSLYEAPDMASLYRAERRERSLYEPVPAADEERIAHPERTVYQWYACVEQDHTDLFCNFGEYDPNQELVEVSVRPCCFFPKRTGVNYITVRGFEMAHAATQWAPPTAEQIGMIGPHWSCGWVIENNHLHDAKCSAVSLGTDRMTGQNFHRRFLRKSGYQYQQEAVFLGIRSGWSKERVGSHVVENNVIHDCGQAAIVGHMGAAFSRIRHNHIYDLHGKQEFFGFEMAGIKLHASLDTVIECNNIHGCSLGIWLDWQAQGARVTKNVFYQNVRDLMIEVTHGPCLVDNNVFLSPVSFQNAAQGTAFVHNLIGGRVRSYDVLDRATPYHFPHTTDVAGYAVTYGGDDRVMNNIIFGDLDETEQLKYLGALLDSYTTEDEYRVGIAEQGYRQDHKKYYAVKQPVWVAENAYAGQAKPFRAECRPILTEGISASVCEQNGEWILRLEIPAAVADACCEEVTAQRLGRPRLTEMAFEDPDGLPVDITGDLLGHRRGERKIPGPFASLHEGVNLLSVWHRE